jgi:phosphoserine phosphatase
MQHEQSNGNFEKPPYFTLREAVLLHPDCFENFRTLDHNLVIHKMYNFKNTPPIYRVCLFDFDNCFTAADGSIYQRICRMLPHEGYLESEADRQECLALEKQGKLTDEGREAWTEREIGRYGKYHLTKGHIEAAMAGEDRLRPGAEYAVRAALMTGARVGFISQGFEDAMRCTELPWDDPALQVRANRLLYDEAEHIIGWSKERRVSGKNKDAYAWEILQASGIPLEQCMVVVMGDSAHDANMVPEGVLPRPEQVLRICVPPSPNVDRQFLQKVLTPGATPYPPYDMTLVGTESLDCIGQIFEWAA